MQSPSHHQSTSARGSQDRDLNNMPAELHTTHVEKSPSKYSAAFTVRARVQPTEVGEGLQLNARYFASIPGIIKIVQLVSLSFLCNSCKDV